MLLAALREAGDYVVVETARVGDVLEHDVALLHACFAEALLQQLQHACLRVRVVGGEGKEALGQHVAVLRHEEVPAAVDGHQPREDVAAACTALAGQLLEELRRLFDKHGHHAADGVRPAAEVFAERCSYGARGRAAGVDDVQRAHGVHVLRDYVGRVGALVQEAAREGGAQAGHQLGHLVRLCQRLGEVLERGPRVGKVHNHREELLHPEEGELLQCKHPEPRRQALGHRLAQRRLEPRVQQRRQPLADARQAAPPLLEFAAAGAAHVCGDGCEAEARQPLLCARL
mmetsp:Transcript_9557/g.39041  ORF Transcript_9557/g.39041 Transcript_9557/m.39041 type:complete len:287 (-) Transcript_9557:8-868(-)